jgi:tetratricopeptide (TPR) repeat protein
MRDGLRPVSRRGPNRESTCFRARAFRDAFLLVCLLFSFAAARGQNAAALIAKGDQFDEQLKEKEALQCYLPANRLEPDNVDLLVRIARQYRHLMSDTTSKTEKLRLGNISLQFAQHAAALAPKDAEAQLSPAISYGKMLPYMTSKDQIAASPRIKAAVDRTLQLDPQNDTAWHILGRWDRVLANVNVVKRLLAKALYGDLPVTTNEQAATCLRKAIAINPNRLIHYIELGRIYAEMGRKEEARTYILKGLSMPDKEKDDPEMKEIGRETLKKLGYGSG